MKLIIEDDEGRKTVVPFVRDEITIGRQEGNTIRLTERNVSRRHARLSKQNGHIHIEDLGSYNGIRVNGDRIKGQVQVGDGDLIQIGDYDLAIQEAEAARAAAATVQMEPTPARAAPTQKLQDTGATMPALPVVETPTAADEDIEEASDDDIASELGDDGLGPPMSVPKNQSTAVIRIDQVEGNKSRRVVDLDPADSPRLVVLNPEFDGREYPVTRTEVKIGRVDDNDVAIDHRSLSRTHCKLVREDSGEWKIIDLQSANGVMVNGEQYAQVTLASGDLIELGHLKLRFGLAGDELDTSPVSGNQPTAEAERPPSSKAPIIALAVAALVLILGGGGYAFIKGRAPVEPVKPEKPVNVARPPDPVEDPVVDPEIARRENEKRLADAQKAIAAMEWETAEGLLRGTKLDNSIHPKAQQLLNQMSAEKGMLTALQNAEAALEDNELTAAQTNLNVAAGTKLLTEAYNRVQKRFSDEVQKRTAQNTVKPPTPPTPREDPRAKAAARIEALVTDARSKTKVGNFKGAANVLKECLELDQGAYNCHKLLGSAYASMGAAENNTKFVDKGLEHYARYIDLAPPDEPDVPKVRKLVEAYKNRNK